MDLGATVCARTRPACPLCPLAGDCRAQARNLVDRIPGRKPKKLTDSRTEQAKRKQTDSRTKDVGESGRAILDSESIRTRRGCVVRVHGVVAIWLTRDSANDPRRTCLPNRMLAS